MDTTPFNSIAQSTLAGFWFPTDASASNQVDGPAIFILWICGIFLVFNAGLMAYFAYRYRQKKKEGASHGQTHNTVLEVTWSVIPAFILGIIFIWGLRNFLHMEQAPDNPYDILVVGKQWSWDFHYPNGHTSRPWTQPGNELPDNNALHVPAGRPVRLTLQSNDVIHSVFLPELRVKKDVVPGRFNQLWFEAEWDPENVQTRVMPTVTGGTVELRYNVYNLYCTEYCGQDHSTMITKVYVYQQDDFEQWLESDSLRDPATPLWQVGRDIWATQCRSCHTIDGSTGSAPTWQNLIGATSHATVNAGTIVADESYIRDSILNPNAIYAAGFPNGGMPSAFSTLDPREVLGVIEFMKTISSNYPDATQGTDAVWGGYNADGTPVAAEGEEADTEGDGTADTDADADAQPQPAVEGQNG